MTDYVVDSCVVAKWILWESDSAQAQRFASDVKLAGARLVVLDLAFVETTNAIWKRFHRKLLTLADTDQLLDKLSRIPVHVEPAQPLLRAALSIATEYRRSVYDALFVALSEKLDLLGITADEPLYNAVRLDFPQIVLLRDWP